MNSRVRSVIALLSIGGLIAFGACDDGGGSGAADVAGGDVTPDGSGAALPAQVSCDGDLCTVEAPLSDPVVEDFTMDAARQWRLRGGVFIGDGDGETVLTLEEGTTVFGDSASKAFLTIQKGSKIMAQGSPEAPIVFTSSQAEGERARGDWGGLVINGNAPINGCNTPPCLAEGEGGSGTYGGDDPADDSGVLSYVRVEFAGFPITEDNELNGIAFQGVGSGTRIDHVQVHMAADDGVEFFGGTAEWKYILTTGISDDSLDWTDGWRGKGQFFVAQQYDDAGDNGIEADNNGENNGATPRSHPTLANLTLVGGGFGDVGLLLREGTAGNLYNVIATGWGEACLDLDDTETFQVAGGDDGTPSGDLTLESSILSCATSFQMDDQQDADGEPVTDPWSVEDFFLDGVQLVDPMLVDATNPDAPDFRPAEGSPARSGATLPTDDFFEPVDFIGGVDPDDDWTQGWTTSARN